MKDLIILGAGPAGLAASIYASRYNIDHLLIGSEIGGYLNEIHKVENYPGFPSISGIELAEKMGQHVKSFGDFIRQETSILFKKIDSGFRVKTDQGNVYEGRNIIYAIGTKCRKLNIPGEEEFLGKGVSYCATCDGPFFKGKDVVVIGGGNSAAMATLMLSAHTTSVSLIYRGEKLKSAPTYVEQIEKAENIKIFYNSLIKEIEGNSVVENVIFQKDGKDERLETKGVFIEIGSMPNSEMIARLGVETNEKGFIVTKQDQSTNIQGFFAAGDITTNSNGFCQIITAAAEGSVAALAIFERIKKNKK